MNIRLNKKSEVVMLLSDGSKFGVEAESRSPTGFYHILSWMIHSVLLYDDQETLDRIIKKQQEKIALLKEVTGE